MITEQCFKSVCFVALDAHGAKFFGFSEFLAGLALMIIAWTVADVRYRFRISIAPLPMQKVTFWVVVVVGTLTLLTDLWRAEQWLVPKGYLLTPASWQALLGAILLLTFLIWAWFAFIHPPTYRRHNAEIFARTLYRFVISGSPTELAVIADELTNSVESLVFNASDNERHWSNQHKQTKIVPKIETYANEILLLIADRRLCRVIVESSPITAFAIFQEMSRTRKYVSQVGLFAKNIMNEAIMNRDSFLYHETDGYDSGLLGYHKPISQCLFSNYQLIEQIDVMFHVNYPQNPKWGATQWEAYCRAVLITFRNYAEQGAMKNSPTLYSAMRCIEEISSDLYTLNGIADVSWDSDAFERFRVSIAFIVDAVNILSENDIPDFIQMRFRDETGPVNGSVFDRLADMIFSLTFHVAAVSSPRWRCWQIQHNTFWSKLFGPYNMKKSARKIVQFKARRLIYAEIMRMNEFPNFKGARILSLCLNVMGLTVRSGSYDRESRPLQKAVLAWVKKHFVWLSINYPSVANACLVEGMTYDAEKLRIMKTFPVEGLRREPKYETLQLDPAPRDDETALA